MTEHPAGDDRWSEEDLTTSRLAWEVPEVVGVVVLVAVGVIMIGGLVSGVARALTESSSNFPPGLSSQETWNAIQFGSEWAGPVVTLIVLGVLGLCWWQVQGWLEVLEAPTADDDLSEASGHLRRDRHIAYMAMVEVIVSAVASLSALVAAVGSNTGESLWVQDISASASLVAVVLLLGVAGFLARRLSRSIADAGESRQPPS